VDIKQKIPPIVKSFAAMIRRFHLENHVCAGSFAHMERLIDMGVDGLITGCPDRLVNVLEASGKSTRF